MANQLCNGHLYVDETGPGAPRCVRPRGHDGFCSDVAVGDVSLPEYDDNMSLVEQVRARRGAIALADPFQRVIDEIVALHHKKGADYGSDKDAFANVRASENFGVPPWLGAIIRLNDKIVRIQSFTRKGNLANESLRDSLIDIAVYSVIATMLYDEAQREV